MPQLTQSRSFCRRSSQPITWLILTSKTLQENTQTRYNSEQANNAKYSKTKLSWFSRLIRQSARKLDGLILQRSLAHMGFVLIELGAGVCGGHTERHL